MEARESSKERKALLTQIEREINQKDPAILQGLSNSKKEKLLETVAITFIKEHSGPLPSPETLEDYNRAVPEGANRIMTVFEKQAAHRMALEAKALGSQTLQSQLGQIFALIIGLFAIGSATYCILQGHDWAGGFLGIGGLTGLVTAFIKGKDYQQENLREKNPRIK